MLKNLSRQQKESIKDRLKELRHRETTPGADPPKPVAFTDAEAFARQLPSPLGEMPHISMAGDGELNFAWNGGPIYIDLGFYCTGTYSYFARDRQGRKHHGDDVLADGPIPADLMQILSG
jgi:hypothetical protein